MRQKREEWAERMPGLDPAKLVFLDETGANTRMTRRYGRSPRGTRLVCPVPHGHWKTTTFVAALRSDGLVAPMVVDGALSGDLFVAYARQVLVPALRPGPGVAQNVMLQLSILPVSPQPESVTRSRQVPLRASADRLPL